MRIAYAWLAYDNPHDVFRKMLCNDLIKVIVVMRLHYTEKLPLLLWWIRLAIKHEDTRGHANKLFSSCVGFLHCHISRIREQRSHVWLIHGYKYHI